MQKLAYYRANLDKIHKTLNKYNKKIFQRREQFYWKQTIGEGGYGKINRVINKNTGMVYAVKSVSLIDSPLQIVQSEIKISLLCRHPFLCICWDAFVEDESAYLVMQYCQKTIQEYLQGFALNKRQKILKIFINQIVSALIYLHSNQIVHRDIKADNILVRKNGNICICDFGSAKIIKTKAKPQDLLGLTIVYSPPQVLNGVYSFSGDVWALGQLIFYLNTGQEIIEDQQYWKEQVLKPIYFKKYSIDPYWLQLLEKILKIDAKSRISLENIQEYILLSESFFSQTAQIIPLSNEFKSSQNSKNLTNSIIQQEQLVNLEEKSSILNSSQEAEQKYFEFVQQKFLSSLKFVKGSVISKHKFLKIIKERFKVNTSMNNLSRIINEEVIKLKLNPDIHHYNKHRKAFIGVLLDNI